MPDISKLVSELRLGDQVDLEGDKFADPRLDKPALQSEYQRVVSVERESTNCIAVAFEGFDLIGFPPDHRVKVAPCQTTKISVPRAMSATQADLAASLACYTSDDDWGDDRRAFLQSVSDRILLDLMTGEY
jgi:hypothetical protein